MGYYETRKKMFELVEVFCKENKHTRSAIVFEVMVNTGLTEKGISLFIDKLIVNDAVKEEGGILTWLNLKRQL